MKQTFFYLFILILISGCAKKKELTKDALPFKWVEEGNKITYDYFSSTDTTGNALQLFVIINPGNNNLRFKYDYPQWSMIPGSKLVGEDFNVYRKKNGLYTSAYTDCSWGAGFGSSFEF